MLYSMEEFSGKILNKFVKYLKSNHLYWTFVKLYKLALLVLTKQRTSASVESSFSVIKGIKSIQKSFHEQERLSSLTLMFLEKKKLQEIRSSPTFYADVYGRVFKKRTNNEISGFIYFMSFLFYRTTVQKVKAYWI